jgi:hypothetical protein
MGKQCAQKPTLNSLSFALGFESIGPQAIYEKKQAILRAERDNSTFMPFAGNDHAVYSYLHMSMENRRMVKKPSYDHSENRETP